MKNQEPAFPVHSTEATPKNAPHAYMAGGLTKREIFAMAAMQGLLSYDFNKGRMICDYDGPKEIAKEARDYADALLAELSKDSK